MSQQHAPAPQPTPGAQVWNHMQVELIPDDRLIKPMIGPGGLTREQAHAEIQSILDRAAEQVPAWKGVADLWRRGAKDDTVYAGPFGWTIYGYAQGEDPRRQALAWLEDYADTMRAAGVTGIGIGIAKLPEERP